MDDTIKSTHTYIPLKYEHIVQLQDSGKTICPHLRTPLYNPEKQSVIGKCTIDNERCQDGLDRCTKFKETFGFSKEESTCPY